MPGLHDAIGILALATLAAALAGPVLATLAGSGEGTIGAPCDHRPNRSREVGEDPSDPATMWDDYAFAEPCHMAQVARFGIDRVYHDAHPAD